MEVWKKIILYVVVILEKALLDTRNKAFWTEYNE